MERRPLQDEKLFRDMLLGNSRAGHGRDGLVAGSKLPAEREAGPRPRASRNVLREALRILELAVS